MRTNHRILFAIPVFVLLAHVACSSDDSTPSSSSTSSSGGSSGTGSSGASSSGGSSSGSSGDSGTTIVTSCATPTRVDTRRGVNGSVGMSAASEGNKWAVAWHQIGAVDDAGAYTYKARVFDGTAMKDEVELGSDVYAVSNGLAGDGAGHAFTQNDGTRSVLDWSTSTFAAGTSFTVAAGGLEIVALGAIPGGGALSLYRNGSNKAVADRWTPGTPTWTATDLDGPTTVVNGLRVYANAAGKGIATWYTVDNTDTTLYITPFSGTTWGTTTSKLFLGADGGNVTNLEGVILSSGDFVLFTHRGGIGGPIQSFKFHAGTGVFDAAVDVGSTNGAESYAPSIVVDSMDRITVAYLDGNHAKARRDVGSGYTMEQDLGAATMVRLDIDRPTGNVAAVFYAMPSLYLRAVGGTSNTWTPTITLTGLGVTNGTFRYMAQTAFDAGGHPIVFSMQEVTGTGVGLGLSYSKCQ